MRITSSLMASVPPGTVFTCIVVLLLSVIAETICLGQWFQPSTYSIPAAWIPTPDF